MKKYIITFNLKFWPDNKFRKLPSDEFLLADEPNIFEMLKYRNEVRLYYLNWSDVWDTYSYITTWYIPLFILLFGILTLSWIGTVLLILLLFGTKHYIIGKNRNNLRLLRILIPGLFDEQLSTYFGPLLPFSHEQD